MRHRCRRLRNVDVLPLAEGPVLSEWTMHNWPSAFWPWVGDAIAQANHPCPAQITRRVFISHYFALRRSAVNRSRG